MSVPGAKGLGPKGRNVDPSWAGQTAQRRVGLDRGPQGGSQARGALQPGHVAGAGGLSTAGGLGGELGREARCGGEGHRDVWYKARSPPFRQG